MLQDEAVISTNDDATSCKRFAVHLGYWSDGYIQYFSKLGERKAPEINRGYYARVKGMRILLDQFLSQTECSCQIINLGAGFDTLFWLLKEEGVTPKLFVEVDFGIVTSRKCYSIRSRRKLQEAFSPDDGLKIEGNEAHSKHYHLLAADLRDVGELESKLNEVGVDKSLPTVFITECVLVYLEPEQSGAIINWAGTNFKTALFTNYEQVNLQDRFGQVMIHNLRGRNCELLGALACPDVESHKQRFLSNNWEKADALDMMNVYNGLPFEDRTRFCILLSLTKVNKDGLEIKSSKGMRVDEIVRAFASCQWEPGSIHRLLSLLVLCSSTQTVFLQLLWFSALAKNQH